MEENKIRCSLCLKIINYKKNDYYILSQINGNIFNYDRSYYSTLDKIICKKCCKGLKQWIKKQLKK